MTDLALLIDPSLGWILSEATAINDNGQIIAYGGTGDGSLHALLFTPIPEPSTLILLGIGAIGLLGFAWRKRFAMKHCRFFSCAFLAACSLATGMPVAHGAITFSGNVEPDPTTWSGTTTGYVGNTSDGTLTIDGGSLSSANCCLGYDSGVTGVMTVNGSGSIWNNNSNMDIGFFGNGILSVLDGGNVLNSNSRISGLFGAGTVTVDGAGSAWSNDGVLDIGLYATGILRVTNGGLVSADTTRVGVGTESRAIYFHGGTLTTNNLHASSSNLTGTGTIYAHGLVSDGMDLVFDSTQGLSQTLTLPDSNVTMYLDMCNTNNVGDLGAGYGSTGTLRITNGVAVNSASGILGYANGSSGTATVDGLGSTWNMNGDLVIGRAGAGALIVVNGGTVRNTNSQIGGYGGTCTVMVDGAGSTWLNDGTINVGDSRTGILRITNGGCVSAETVRVDPDGINMGHVHLQGGTLSSNSLYARWSDLTGTGTISTHGLVADDMDLVFDSIDDFNQSFMLPDSSITVNLTVSDSTNLGVLGVGYQATGTLKITNGVAVSSASGVLGSLEGSSGTASVDGSGSTWNNTGSLQVGNCGTGVLSLTNGGKLFSDSSNIGNFIGSGTATVDGAGSTWNNAGALDIGLAAHGLLNITNGGSVVSVATYICGSDETSRVVVDGTGSNLTNSGFLLVMSNGNITIRHGGTVSSGSVGLYSPSVLSIDVGKDSCLVVDGGNGLFSNDGVIRLTANVGAAVGATYRPILAGTWSVR